jgi:hypothetical protein
MSKSLNPNSSPLQVIGDRIDHAAKKQRKERKSQ